MKKFIVIIICLLMGSAVMAPPQRSAEETELQWKERQIEKLNETIVSMEREAVRSDTLVQKANQNAFEYATEVGELKRKNDSLNAVIDSITAKQENMICLPVEQANALFQQAKVAGTYKKEIVALNLMISSLKETDSLKTEQLYTYELLTIQQDSVIYALKKIHGGDPKWKKWLYGAIGSLAGVGLGTLIK